MTIFDDFTISTNGDIRHTANTNHYTVLEFHRFLQDLADDAVASGNDLVDITSTTPSERSTDNIITLLVPYNIDDDAAEYLYAGSIKQGSGVTETIYSGLKVLGAVNNTDTQIQIIQNNALYQATPFWGTQATGGYNGDVTAGVLFRVLVKSRESGQDIDGKRVRVQARHWGDTYDFFNVTLGEGESVAAIATTPDAQNNTSQAIVTAYTHITNEEGYQTINLNNGNGFQPYYSKWSFGANNSGDKLKGIWEYIKDIISSGTSKTIHGINGELFLGITHQWAYDTEVSGPFIENSILTWGTGSTAGTGLLLALKDDGTTGTMWIQLLTGVAPSASMTITSGSATCSINGSVISRTVPKVCLGSYTGTLIGAFGIGVTASDVTTYDTVQDLNGVTQIPPNNVIYTVSGLVQGEDYVLVGPKGTGNAFNFEQLTLKTALTGVSTSIICNTIIPSDTPASGTLRIHLASGTYKRVEYTFRTGDTFTIVSTDFSDENEVNVGAGIMITYIDTLAAATSASFTTIFSSPRSLYIRVRDGGNSPIKTFESPGTLGVAGGSVVASRITDA